MERATKYCDLTVQLRSGGRVTGKFHVPLQTGSTIRPSDALRGCKDGFVIISDAVMQQGEQEHRHIAILVPLTSVDYIELPAVGWTTTGNGSVLKNASAAPSSAADIVRFRA